MIRNYYKATIFRKKEQVKCTHWKLLTGGKEKKAIGEFLASN